ncbi:NUDIX hydrolase [Spirosoma fluviale]|uniref:8-oxo-dGTP pyrophosphatase MutT, NUDIX family n=1 Tax=Spirosoma fluviale TaxID=1597977 RepID=A0A286FC05_9BACT|nr:NUDIX hydrolase [Spirosoma fluviale]SOD80771.1 8-oxo-dGTP pyrophosphatase MutT, NUDIX family [Spirosoma fluviale]
MYRKPLLSLLHQHTPADKQEQAMTEETITFVRANPDCFDRSLLVGHITGSAWICSPDRQQVLLIHHRKLDRWLQPGGHADGDPNVAAVALREAQEETGLASLRLLSDSIFDVDIHEIPTRKEAPAHLHYDIRFCFEADPLEPFGNSGEIKNIQWFSLKDAKELANERSISRMLEKKVQ